MEPHLYQHNRCFAVTHVLKTTMLMRKGCTKNQDLTSFNPLSPNSDQHQFSPNNIHTLSRD